MKGRGHVGILGGGAVGLSIAYELLQRSWAVTVFDRLHSGPSSSWAGAGILMPYHLHSATHPLDRLCGLSNPVHEQWSRQLLSETQIDNGFWNCGGLYIARTVGEVSALLGQESWWTEEGIDFKRIPIETLSEEFTLLDCSKIKRAVWLPGESQIRNPDHLSALRQAISLRGGTILSDTATPLLDEKHGRVDSIAFRGNRVVTDFICICSGAWSGQIAEGLGLYLPTTPIRGQMLLYKQEDTSKLNHIINEGPRYVVPRRDGYLLVGSTMEEVGFDTSTTAFAQEQLHKFAESILPDLRKQSPSGHWSGLRPASFDGLPYIGWLSNIDNGLIAAGHFRLGLQASAGTARIIADLLEFKTPPIDIEAFRPSRVH